MHTKLQKIVIKKFRALSGVEIEFGDYITVICGKNGTAKSSILGIAAQIFSFDEDYVNNNYLSDFKQINGQDFKSKYSEHMRISAEFDKPGSLLASINIHDGYLEKAATAELEFATRNSLSTEKALPRPVVRKNSTAEKNKSRNFTHPVIFLSLKRLFPIADRSYEAVNFSYMEKHKAEFLALSNKVLNRGSTRATGTQGTISSAVSHGDNYNHESVSAGEDNVGQLVMALMSFKKLSEEYAEYKGGLLLIDEADAALFPTAQVNLLKTLGEHCRHLNLQVVMTSHSPVMIEYAYNESIAVNHGKFKVIYLSDTYGPVKVMKKCSWQEISNDIHTTTSASKPQMLQPKVNVYFEDKEASDFFAALMYRKPSRARLNEMSKVTLGYTNYLELITKKIPEFCRNSVICLDVDVRLKRKSMAQKNAAKSKNIVFLPGILAPDQLLLQHLNSLPPEDHFWSGAEQYTKSWFTNRTSSAINALNDNVSSRSIGMSGSGDSVQGPARDIFKTGYKNISDITKAAWRHWVKANPCATEKFLREFDVALNNVAKSNYALDGKVTKGRSVLK